MSEQKKNFEELKENDLEQIAGGYYAVGQHVVCFRGIKWEVIEVTRSGSYNCRAISWPENWDNWVKSMDYVANLSAFHVVGTW